MKPWLVSLSAGLLWACSGHAAEPDWSIYADLLKQYVAPQVRHDTPIQGVHYTALRQDARFGQVVALISRYDPQALATPRERLAFYINAYNILAMKVVLDHWPLQGIKEAGGFLTPVWKIEAGTLAGQGVSLDHVEHKILRPMGDPRMHMAIVCASVSCPDLRPEPYTAGQLEQQLEDQTRGFLANTAKGMRVEGHKVYLSMIFEWFGQDFEKAGGVTGFIRRYYPMPDNPEVLNISYNWQLNGQ